MNYPTAEQDPFLFDIEQLQAIATESVIQRGLSHFQNNSVTELSSTEIRLHAFVEDMSSGETLNTDIQLDEDGNLFANCDCPDNLDYCHHAIALLNYQLIVPTKTDVALFCSFRFTTYHFY